MNACWPGLTRPYSWRAICSIVALSCSAELSRRQLGVLGPQDGDRALLGGDALFLGQVRAGREDEQVHGPAEDQQHQRDLDGQTHTVSRPVAQVKIVTKVNRETVAYLRLAAATDHTPSRLTCAARSSPISTVNWTLERVFAYPGVSAQRTRPHG